MRFRIRTMMIVVLILALVTALIVQRIQAGRREADLQAQLQAAVLAREVSEIAIQEQALIHQQDMLQLRSQIVNIRSTSQGSESGPPASNNRQ